VGLIGDYERRAGYAGLKAGDTLVLIGPTHGELGSSLYLRELFGREDGAPPPVDLELERRNGDFVRRLIASGQTSVVHDLSDGGLVCAAAEMALASGVGVTLRADSPQHAHLYLFGEDQGRYLIAVADPQALIEAAHAAGVQASLAGHAAGDALASPGLFEIQLSALRAANEGWLPAYMAGPGGHADSGPCHCGHEH
jgi:phosphoribosylformylglycinamidine synthase